MEAWALGALMGLVQLLFGMMLMRLWKSVDDNTNAVNRLSIDLPTHYTSKEESNRHHEEDRQSFEDARQNLYGLRDRVHGMDLRVTAIEQQQRNS